ncbi:MAG: hypothetical protein U1E93_10930 [Alphaproteobacteria bacterium]
MPEHPRNMDNDKDQKNGYTGWVYNVGYAGDDAGRAAGLQRSDAVMGRPPAKRAVK